MTLEAISDKLIKGGTLTTAEKDWLRNYDPKRGSGQGLLYEYFTPTYLCDLMYRLAIHYGYNEQGTILEPAAGIGRFLEVIPEHLHSNVTAFEINPHLYHAAKVLYPEAKWHNQYFETAFLQPPRFTTTLKESATWLPDAPYDLVIGNPPYGKRQNRYSFYFKTETLNGQKVNVKGTFPQLETFFIYKSLKLLKEGGLLVFITASGFLRNGGIYDKSKEVIGEIAELVDAYRMPKVFGSTDVPTDVIILRKK
ncbi:class I SAM-dependent methyltransferase [Limibacter armeniacum]|uniref:class I SAM-dependent methyltransferase n=1 Tax=Limibacter armeniacum TaxID=466084 RepID=UPI002FE551B4